MNENKEYCYETEREIDLTDMIFYLIKRWRSFVIFVLVGGLLGCGICILKKEVIEMTPEQTVLSGAYEPDPEMLKRMRQAVMYRILYEERNIYQQESFIMQMDSNAVYTGELEYYLSAGNDTQFLGEKLKKALMDDVLMSELCEIVGNDKEPQYIREVLSSSLSLNDTTVNLDAEEDNFRDAVIVYTVYFGDRATCEAMMQAIQRKVESLVREYRSEYHIDSFEKIEDYIELRTNKDFATQQRNNADLMNTYISNWSRWESEIIQEPLNVAYYNFICLEYDSTGVPEYVTGLKQEISVKAIVKWMTVGMILTVGLWGVYFVLKYLLDKTVKTAEELKRIYDVPLLGYVILSGSKRNLIDRMVANWSARYDMTADSLEYVIELIGILNISKAVISGASDDVKDWMFKEMRVANTKLHVTSFLHQNGEALREALASDGEILIVEKGKTLHREIERELEICYIQNIKVLGIIVIG